MSQVAVTKIAEGNSHIVIRVDMLSDGSGELINRVILSPSDLEPVTKNNATAFRIMQIWSGLPAFDVTFGFGTLSPKTIWTTAVDGGNHIDFRSFGGLMDYATKPASDVDGKLWISTRNFTPVGTAGSLVLELRKTNSASA